MMGLGIGSHAGGLLSERVTPRRALLVFALLELGIASFGLATPRASTCDIHVDKGSLLLPIRHSFASTSTSATRRRCP